MNWILKKKNEWNFYEHISKYLLFFIIKGSYLRISQQYFFYLLNSLLLTLYLIFLHGKMQFYTRYIPLRQVYHFLTSFIDAFNRITSKNDLLFNAWYFPIFDLLIEDCRIEPKIAQRW